MPLNKHLTSKLNRIACFQFFQTLPGNSDKHDLTQFFSFLPVMFPTPQYRRIGLGFLLSFASHKTHTLCIRLKHLCSWTLIEHLCDGDGEHGKLCWCNYLPKTKLELPHLPAGINYLHYLLSCSAVRAAQHWEFTIKAWCHCRLIANPFWFIAVKMSENVYMLIFLTVDYWNINKTTMTWALWTLRRSRGKKFKETVSTQTL